jgi:hypothetical protein
MAPVAAGLIAVPSTGGAPAAEVKRIYRITVTATVTTEMIGSGADNFRGTVSWTHTYPRVRFQVRGGSVTYRPNRTPTGTAVVKYDHQGDSCGPIGGLSLRETGTARGRSLMRFGASYPQLGLRRGPFPWGFFVASFHAAPGSSGDMTGDIPTCDMRHAPLVVGAANYSASMAGFDARGKVRRPGLAGFPLNRLLAGKGFSYSSRGTNRNTKRVRDDLRYAGYAYATDGSMRVVFTPVG